MQAMERAKDPATKGTYGVAIGILRNVYSSIELRKMS